MEEPLTLYKRDTTLRCGVSFYLFDVLLVIIVTLGEEDMVSSNESSCPFCNGDLKYYDTVFRIVRTKRGLTNKVRIRRLRCVHCGRLHRELPDSIFPYKQYEADIIVGVVEGLITVDTLGFEDYPCEQTMFRWCEWASHISTQVVLTYRNL